MTILSDKQPEQSSDNRRTDHRADDDTLHPQPPSPHHMPATKRLRKGKKERLDLLLVNQGVVESREQAQRLIMAGEVLVNEEVRTKPGQMIAHDATLRIRNQLPYVSRGGHKLAGALDDFGLDVSGLAAIDVGASTGGFTDCLLQRGAAHVFAVDVGYGQLAWKLRSDPRVTVMERTNIRHLNTLPGEMLADLAVIDASFISLALVLPATLKLLQPEGEIIALIKPQFEAGKKQVGKGGVVRKAEVHRAILEENCHLASGLDLAIYGLTLSPLLGPAGNVEFLVWYRRWQPNHTDDTAQQLHAIDIQQTIAQLMIKAQQLRGQRNG